jgi:hypothetical protein
MAKIALVGTTIPRSSTGLVFGGTSPSYEFLGNQSMWVFGSNKFIDLIPIEIRSLRTRLRLQMMSHSSSGSERVPTKRAFDLLASMSARIEMLGFYH